MFQLVSEVKQIPPCFHRAVRYFSVLLAEPGWRTLRQSLELRCTDCGPRENTRTHTHTHHKRLQSTDRRRVIHRRVHLQIRISPVHSRYTTNRRTRPHTLLPFMHGHHTQPRDTRAHTGSRTCAHLRAHAHTPCTHPLAHAHALVHMHTPRAHTHTRSTQRLVHAHTLARPRSHRRAGGGAGRERQPGPRRRRQERARRRGPRPARVCLP